MIQRKLIRLCALAALATVAAACSMMRPAAPVVDRVPPRAEPTKPKTGTGRGFYTVKKGDTLYRIALEFGQNFQDLVAWNNLANANDIKVDQVLRVLPPEGGADTAQAGIVAPVSGVEVKPIAGTQANTNKTGPRGDKRPYSDIALAELQKPDGVLGASDPSRNTTAKAEEKITDATTKPATEETLEWIWPTEGKLVSGFDAAKKGIDIAGKLGQPILAAGSGTVLYAGKMRGYGNLVIVKHTPNLLSAYAHGKSILVKEGQTVSKGQRIAEMGNSDTDAVKLHFEIRQQGKPVDPTKFLPSR
jgi:lipoprotein NlpD